ncbi:MAG: sugar-binding protein, partial [Owenweeksia sp.]
TIINDEDTPMQVELSAENSSDLALFLPANSVTIPPNNRKTLKLQFQSRDGKWETPALLKAQVHLKSENEPAKLSYPYRFNLKPIPYRKLEKTTSPKTIDGQLNDWKDLRYSFERDNGQVKVQFDVSYDEQFLYMAARVTDDVVVSTGEGAAWVQDNIAFGFNAEKSSRSAMSVGRHWYQYEFLQLITPEYEGVGSVLYRDMPEGSLVKCIKTSTGYDAEIAVPLSYIEEKQGKNWKSIRVNIGLDDRDEGPDVNRYSWQPLWRNADNVVGSGLFLRE